MSASSQLFTGYTLHLLRSCAGKSHCSHNYLLMGRLVPSIFVEAQHRTVPGSSWRPAHGADQPGTHSRLSELRPEGTDTSIHHHSPDVQPVRTRACFSQTRLGEKVGVSAEVIQKIEAGNSLQPRCIMELGEALCVNPAWLQFGEPWARKESPIEPDWLVKEKPATRAG